MDNAHIISVDDVLKARRVLAGKINRTPMLTSHSIGDQLGISLFFKAENFQKTGAFKVRGTLNKMHNLTAEEKARGVIALSTGNHAAGLAYAASQAGVEATVVMPQNAVKAKVDATRLYGAEVILHGEGKDLWPKVQEIQAQGGQIFVSPFDDPYIIAGQGTIGLEILEDVPAPDIVIVPVGGGSALSGIARVVKAANPATKVYGVEPFGAAAMSKSLEQNAVYRMGQMDTIADGLAAPFTGEYTLAHAKAFVDEIILVTDEEIVTAMRLIMERCKIVVEPAAAASLATMLSGRLSVPQGSTVVCFLSGGNIDTGRMQDLFTRFPLK